MDIDEKIDGEQFQFDGFCLYVKYVTNIHNIFLQKLIKIRRP